MRLRFLSCLCALLLAGPAFAAPEAEPPAEKLRKALDQLKDFEIANQPLSKFTALLAEQTGIPFTVDAALQPLQALNVLQLSGLSLHGSKLRVGLALNAVLAPHGMTHVILDGKVLLTTSERAAHFALRQKLNVQAEKETPEVVFKRLARETAVDIVLDPQAWKEKENPISLRLSNVSLEAAVQVLAASAGLESVRLDNILFVTTPARAKTLRAAAADLRTPLPGVPKPFGVMAGGGLMGLMGGSGMAGVGGLAGLGGGLAGNVGALGIGGGMAGQRGGLMGMAGGAGFTGAPPPKQKPKEKPPKKTSGSVGKAAQAAAALMLVTARHQAPAPKPVPVRPRYRLPAALRRTQDVLNVPEHWRDIDDPSITLAQMLNALSKKFSRPGDTPPFFLTLDLNERAFQAAGVKEVGTLCIAEKAIPGAVHLSMAAYLRRLLVKCKVPTEVVLRKNVVEITTRQAFLAEFYGDRPKKDLDCLPPLVNMAFDRRPLDEALEELAGTTEGFSVVLNRAAPRKKMRVSATFRNVPLDTAVWTLADMADLTVMRKGNLLYVTQKKKSRRRPVEVVGKPADGEAASLFVALLAPAPKPVPARPRYRLPVQLRLTRNLLNVPQEEFKEIDDPSITLSNMLNALSKKYSRPKDTPPFYLTFEVNERAFKTAGVEMDKLLNAPIAEKKFPGAVNVTLSRYLRKLLERCPGSAEFVLRKDGVEITTRQAVLAEFYSERSKKELETALPPLVNVAFDRQPLDEALEELARTTEGFNVVLNGAVKDKKVAVSATFRNVPLDTAVWTLADMAGLSVTRKGNMLYVTQKQPARGKRHRKR